MAKSRFQHDHQIHLLYKIKRLRLTRMIALQSPSFQTLYKSIILCPRFQTSIAHHTTPTTPKKTNLEPSPSKKKNKNKSSLTSTMFWPKISLWNGGRGKKAYLSTILQNDKKENEIRKLRRANQVFHWRWSWRRLRLVLAAPEYTELGVLKIPTICPTDPCPRTGSFR